MPLDGALAAPRWSDNGARDFQFGSLRTLKTRQSLSAVSAAEMIDSVVREHFAPAMKARGFRKTARNWHRDLDEVVQVVNVQGSSWNDADQARFTINLGLWFPEADAVARGSRVSNRRPPEHLCTLRSRIGRLMPDCTDWWWELRSGRDVERVGTEAVQGLVELGLPWLDACAKPLDAFEYLRQTNYVGHSPANAFALALAADRRDLAQTAYDSWRSQPDVVSESPIHEWAAKHGLG